MGVKCGEWGLGAGAVSKVKNIYKLLSVSQDTPLLSDGNANAKQRKTMETSTGELIAKLTNISMNLALQLNFKDAATIMEAVGVLHALPNIAETIRHEWHPSSNVSGPAKGISYLSSVKLADND